MLEKQYIIEIAHEKMDNISDCPDENVSIKLINCDNTRCTVTQYTVYQTESVSNSEFYKQNVCLQAEFWKENDL